MLLNYYFPGNDPGNLIVEYIAEGETRITRRGCWNGMILLGEAHIYSLARQLIDTTLV